jgi:hypothetical protein
MRALKATLYTIATISVVTVFFLWVSFVILTNGKLFLMVVGGSVIAFVVYKIWREFYDLEGI